MPQRAGVAGRPSKPDLALIDWMLPDMSGLELTRMLKRDKGNEDLGIIMLTARADEYDKIAGLEGGADDYVTKPFAPRELVARIQAVLRRSRSSDGEIISAGVLELDSAGHRVSAHDQEIRLGPTEYRLLRFLMTHPDRVYSRTQLLDRVWGANVYVEERTVDVHIRRLRKALSAADADDYIQTVRGAGYRFSDQGRILSLKTGSSRKFLGGACSCSLPASAAIGWLYGRPADRSAGRRAARAGVAESGKLLGFERALRTHDFARLSLRRRYLEPDLLALFSTSIRSRR